MKKNGSFIISLDFELNWGVRDVYTLEQYAENLIGGRKAIDEMLKLFNHYDISVTWATVGLLYFGNKKELLSNLPSVFPSYRNADFSPYTGLEYIGESEEQDPFHFGKSLIEKIVKYKGHEIGSHTFSHYYCLEDGQTPEQFEEDLKLSQKLSSSIGHRAKSIVFPRNQINDRYLDICEKHGIECYRGNERSWIYKESSFCNEGILKRVSRLVDTYINITGHNTYRLSNVKKEPIVNLPSSRFLRAYHPKLRVLERLRLKRIKDSMTFAAKNGEVFHLWWHPHNFGKNTEENLGFLTEILDHAIDLKRKYEFNTLTMEEATALALRGYKNEFNREAEALTTYSMTSDIN